MLLDFIMMRARIWDRQRRYMRTWAPDTSDIPEVLPEWFKTAKLVGSASDDNTQRVPFTLIDGDARGRSGAGTGGGGEPPTRKQD